MKAANERDAAREEVFMILTDIGAIKTCPYHDDYYYSTGMESNQVYAYASNRYKARNGVKNVPGIIRDQIKDILDETTTDSECPWCKKAMEE